MTIVMLDAWSFYVLHFIDMENKDITNAELLEAISNGFTGVQEQIENLDQRLSVKIDGVHNSLDSEILRGTDEYIQLTKRITVLEHLHGIEPEKKEPIIA